MPPRFAFWTIILDNQPTAFRARERETLLPTLKQLQSKNPDAVMKWFARGRLWESPEDARRQQRISSRFRRARDRRGPEWRPGGSQTDARVAPTGQTSQPQGHRRTSARSDAAAKRRASFGLRERVSARTPGEPGGEGGKKPRRSD
jgi:hypothetical protein